MWQFTGFLEPGTVKVGHRRMDMHGPLPVKRWNRLLSLGKRHKMNYRTSRTVKKPRHGGKEAYEATAIEYCRWLAKRDGTALPETMKAQAFWYGDHIKAVQWGRHEPVYSTLKTGKRGAWRYNAFVPVVSIEIPNFDWEPIEPIEETVRPGDELVRWVEFALAA